MWRKNMKTEKVWKKWKMWKNEHFEKMRKNEKMWKKWNNCIFSTFVLWRKKMIFIFFHFFFSFHFFHFWMWKKMWKNVKKWKNVKTWKFTFVPHFCMKKKNTAAELSNYQRLKSLETSLDWRWVWWEVDGGSSGLCLIVFLGPRTWWFWMVLWFAFWWFWVVFDDFECFFVCFGVFWLVLVGLWGLGGEEDEQIWVKCRENARFLRFRGVLGRRRNPHSRRRRPTLCQNAPGWTLWCLTNPNP